MKHTWLLSVAALVLAAGSAVAADSSSPSAPAATPGGAAGGDHHPWTLAEARKHAHERADKLDKMTEKEWQEEEAKRHQEFAQKWHGMSDEEKKAWKDMKHKNMSQSGNPASPAAASPSAGGSN